MCTRDDTLDIVIVASAGGALRAAVWTGSILGALQDSLPKFKNCLLAISSVSGGSLGAVAFLSTVREGGPTPFEQRIRKGLNHDFLGPVMASLVVNDGLFAPFRMSGANRAMALETAWEENWRDPKTGKLDKFGFDAEFLSLWQKDPQTLDDDVNWPILLLNGTHAQTGRRILTSNVNTEGRFLDAYDFFSEFPELIRASTAVHNSARFSYISPAGGISKADSQVGHIIDGGYFENYGAETALELIARVMEVAGNNNRPERLHFEVIQIASDPDLPEQTISSDLCAFPDTKLEHLAVPEKSEFGSDATSQLTVPVKGLLQTRESRGIQAAQRLACRTRSINGTHRFINLKVHPGDQKPPLSWFLSKESLQEICELVGHSRDSRDALQQILMDLAPPASEPQVLAAFAKRKCAEN
jgi:hypothetical protein